jgi:hypothetical protein
VGNPSCQERQAASLAIAGSILVFRFFKTSFTFIIAGSEMFDLLHGDIIILVCTLGSQRLWLQQRCTPSLLSLYEGFVRYALS